jgi:Icc-related predicted phosphoesterase
MSCSKDYKTDPTWNAYSNRFEYDIIEAQPNLWLHGHIHSNVDYIIGQTRIVCNPRGYHDINSLNPDFNPSLTIKL